MNTKRMLWGGVFLAFAGLVGSEVGGTTIVAEPIIYQALPAVPLERAEVPWLGIRNNVFDCLQPKAVIPPKQSERRRIDFDWFSGAVADFPLLKLKRVTLGDPFGAEGFVLSVWDQRLGHLEKGATNSRAIIRDFVGPEKTIGLESGGRRVRTKVGSLLTSGSTVVTGHGNGAAIFLGENGPAIWVAENTELEFARLSILRTETAKVIDTMIDLRRGKIRGSVKKLAAGSSYVVRTKGGLARVRGTEFEIRADGTCAIISGAAEVIAGSRVYRVGAGEIFEGGRERDSRRESHYP